MPPSYFPLRWESTGDQWWYATPIDWAAANGLYDIVRELLHLDTNLLIKLTSLRRIRRLEMVWDDEDQFDDVAKCRSEVARKLLLEYETKRGYNSLIRAGYGGWLLYTAASAGDVDFLKQLLERDPLLVFGEGEYGVTDILYAAARSKKCDAFRLLLDFALASSNTKLGSGAELESCSDFEWEMKNRAVHAAARGGNLVILKELLSDISESESESESNVLSYRDSQGSTILHTASGRGQLEVVKDLVASFPIITSKDDQGNTALHVAAYGAYLSVVEILVPEAPSIAASINNHGDTFLHTAVAGFRSPGFRRLDKHIELMKQLTSGNVMNLSDIIHLRNRDGRTALHVAVMENIPCNVVELLMSVPSIDLNIRDCDGMTPLDLLKQRPRSVSSGILIKQLISAGAISHHNSARKSIVSHLRSHCLSRSPGTSFRIPDAEIFLYTGLDNVASCEQESEEFNTCSGEISNYCGNNSLSKNKSSSASYASRRLKFLLRWSRKREAKERSNELEDNDSLESLDWSTNFQSNLIPLRQRYSKIFSLPNSHTQNQKTLSDLSYHPSLTAKHKFAVGLMHGVIQVNPQVILPSQSPCSPFSGSPIASPFTYLDKKTES